jgi:hypothetical protein
MSEDGMTVAEELDSELMDSAGVFELLQEKRHMHSMLERMNFGKKHFFIDLNIKFLFAPEGMINQL